MRVIFTCSRRVAHCIMERGTGPRSACPKRAISPETPASCRSSIVWLWMTTFTPVFRPERRYLFACWTPPAATHQRVWSGRVKKPLDMTFMR